MENIWTGMTLIDITETGVRNGNSTQRDQQRNWESVLQVLSLKTQPHVTQGPLQFIDDPKEDPSLVAMCFGDFYHNKKQQVWAFVFYGDRDDVYDQDQLLDDFDQVPVILGLDETAKFMLPIFHGSGTLKNIHFFLNELNIK